MGSIRPVCIASAAPYSHRRHLKYHSGSTAQSSKCRARGAPERNIVVSYHDNSHGANSRFLRRENLIFTDEFPLSPHLVKISLIFGVLESGGVSTCALRGWWRG